MLLSLFISIPNCLPALEIGFFGGFKPASMYNCFCKPFWSINWFYDKKWNSTHVKFHVNSKLFWLNFIKIVNTLKSKICSRAAHQKNFSVGSYWLAQNKFLWPIQTTFFSKIFFAQACVFCTEHSKLGLSA